MLFRSVGQQGPAGPVGPAGQQGSAGQQGPAGNSLVGNDTPDKVHQLGDTVAYYSNGLKLFEIKVTGIGSENPTSTWVQFVFTPHTFVEPTQLGGVLSARLFDNTTQTYTNNDNSISNPDNRNFVFPTRKYGNQTLYICITSSYIPFAVYNLSLTAPA